MLSITEHIEFIKRQVDFYRYACDKLAEKLAQNPNPQNAKRYADKLVTNERLLSANIRMLEAAIRDTENDKQNESSLNLPDLFGSATYIDDGLATLLNQPTTISPASLAGLPAELITQLQISDSDRFQWDVLDLIDRTPDKTISIEVLLIALYRMTGKVYERTDLANRIYRLGRRGVIFSVPSKKGWYTTMPQNGELDLAQTDESEGEA